MMKKAAPKEFTRRKADPGVTWAYLALFLATLIWALATPVIRLTLRYINPFEFLFFRFLIVCVVVLPFIISELRKNPIDHRDLPKIILLGVFGQASISLIFIGLKYTTAIDTAIIGILAPILSIAAGHYYYNEKVRARVKAGITLASLGTALIVIEPVISSHGYDGDVKLRIMGNLLVVAYNFMFLLYIIWSKMILGKNSANLKRSLKIIHIPPMKRSYPATLITLVTFYVGFSAITPLALIEHFTKPPIQMLHTLTYTAVPVAGILYMALMSSIVAYTLFEWALNTASVGDSAIFNYLSPILTLPFAYLLLGEIPTITMIVGATIIGCGVVIAEYRKS